MDRPDGHDGSSRRSGASSALSASPSSSTRCSRRSCSPTSSARPQSRHASATHAWKELVERHHATVREALAAGGAWRTTPPATASTPPSTAPRARSTAHMRCADRVRDLGIEIRAGVHTGECELIDGKVGGIAVTTGARIAALAQPSQVLVSQTVKDLVAGSRLSFTSRRARAEGGSSVAGTCSLRATPPKSSAVAAPRVNGFTRS